ncbi:MAG: hypothetical protein H6821_13940 [Planctomycetaceae bacterium]|nr:hypothetical protein [Planctomycetales bacterium]MCB9875271.1 hypothetical protein [Planctomycetaceae bacterium]MCB9938945.1 hypothetical protein [Planctomycetaceae bacterium]
MSFHRLLTILLAAGMAAQSVIAGWGHSHTHTFDGSPATSGDVAIHSHHHHHDGSVHHHAHPHDASHEHPQPVDRPGDQEDCAICRHMALAAVLTFDLDATSVEETAGFVPNFNSLFFSTSVEGLRRPRSPPELS